MLPKENRLKKKKDFERVFKEGRGFKEDFLFLKVIKNNLKINRFGFLIGKNFSKKSTLRNKIRRRLSEIIRLKTPKLKNNFDAILIIVPSLEIKDFWEIEEAINKIFLKAKLFRDSK